MDEIGHSFKSAHQSSKRTRITLGKRVPAACRSPMRSSMSGCGWKGANVTQRDEHPATDSPAIPHERAVEVENVIARVTRWAADRDDILGLLLVGSYARNAARPDSDLDLVVLTNETGRYAD